MGGKVTTKANLYSLGAMLYEMVTGRPPFVGDDSLSIMGQRINTPPISPTWHRADLSPVLSPPLKSVFHKHECYSIILQIYYNWSVMESKVTLKIPRELYQKLGKMIEGTGFSSVTEFIVFVMRTLASSGEIKGEDRLTTEEVTAIRERLRRLGYLKEGE